MDYTAKELLGELGYSQEQCSEGYGVQMDGTSALQFECVAFSDKYLKDISTSCIAVQTVSAEEEARYLEGVKYLAAPVFITFVGNRIRIWKVTLSEPKLIQNSEADIIRLYFEKNRFEFMPDRLMNAKTGYHQITLFEAVGLIDFSREATCRILSEEFEKGLFAAKKYLEKKKGKINSQHLNRITGITMHIISALIIRSKIQPKEAVDNIFKLLEELSVTYKEYFRAELMYQYGKDLVSEIFESLNCSINYQSVDHELLGYFYESTLLQQDEAKQENIRKKFGIYYTPKVLSQEIVSSIPFEDIPMEKRYVLDGTCGSGSLLLSACKRLDELASYDKKDYDKHEYLTMMLEGYDVDAFASEVARLSLLLYSIPYGNRWNVKAGNLLLVDSTQIQTPYVVLGNPPYREARGDGQKKQKAMEFLDKYMDWLHQDGFIGIILPESFLQNDSSRTQRRRLLEEFDILELWMLPGKIFENNCSTVVVIAQKKHALKDSLTRVRMLARNGESIRRFFGQRKWDFEFYVNLRECLQEEKKYRITLSPVARVLQKLEKEKKKIGMVSRSVTGIMLSSNFVFSKQKTEGAVPYLATASDFRRYTGTSGMYSEGGYFNYHMTQEEENEIKKYYGGFRLRREHEDIYSAKNKVLVKMSSTPGEIDCISALVEENGYFPSHSFFAIDSTDDKISNIALCALLNSKVVNAFVRWKCVKRTLTTDVIRSIPVPDFSDTQIESLERIFYKIKNAYECGTGIEKYQEQIDDIVMDAFGLKMAERKKIRNLYVIYKKGKKEPLSKERKHKKYYNVSGQVEEVNTDKKYCKIVSVEFGTQKIKIDGSMPGWFVREGAEFSAKYSSGKLWDIRPLVYSYLDDDGLMELLDRGFSGNGGGK